MKFHSTYLAVTLMLAALCAVAQGRERANLIVAVNGQGDFRSIQEALDSVPAGNGRPVIILVRNGVYNEKVFIQKSHITLVGENRDSTRIVLDVLREEWHKHSNGSDWGAGVVNIDTAVTDITFANLTIYNNYGWKHGVFNKHQFAIRGAGTRIMLLHCTVVSDGGDAVSLWNKQNGMYYHADCFFEGWVDFVCPRGWCYITNSRFFGHNKSASLWHDGSGNRNQKFVITDSYFDGVPGFPLGRHHRDGQFYLLNCTFSSNMANRPIYLPVESPNAREWVWGQRHYYYGCKREGGDFAWFTDNLDKAENSPEPAGITAQWAFDGQWDPESNMPSVLPFAYLPTPKRKAKEIDKKNIRLTWVPGRNAISHKVSFGTSTEPQFRARTAAAAFQPGRLSARTTYYWRVDTVTEEGDIPGELWSFTTN
ncbi:MAG: pectin esterase [Bacteroidetes bacterium]|nr:pectin esterase [Bacteroidota bacterium]MCW5894121.1 pectin esterase [Bacteroidota bacterium]